MLIEIRGVVIDLIRIGYIGFKGVFFFYKSICGFKFFSFVVFRSC